MNQSKSTSSFALMLHCQGLELLVQDHTSQILNRDGVGTGEVPSLAEELLAIGGI